jgi:ABC-type branched-subunit amino acid transport system substrate-binding protein
MVALVVGACGSSTSSSSGPIKIGVTAPITGSLADAGTDIVNAAELAASDINASGGLLGRQVQIIPEDDQCDSSVGVQAAQQLLTEGIIAIAGSYCSGAAIPESDVLHRNGDLPFIGAAPSNVTFTERGYDNVFRMIGRDDWEGPAVATYMYTSLNAHKIAIIDDNTDFSVGLAKAAAAEFKSLGGQVVFTDAITAGRSDYTAELTRVGTYSPDVMYFTGLYPEFGIIAKNYGAISPNFKLVGGGADIDPSIVAVAGSALATPNIQWVTSPFTKFLPNAAAFTAKYAAKFGRSPGDVAGYEYDAMTTLAKAIQSAGSTKASALNSALHSVNFEGLTGTIKFDSKGDRTAYRYVASRYENSKFVVIANAAGSGSTWTWAPV